MRLRISIRKRLTIIGKGFNPGGGEKPPSIIGFNSNIMYGQISTQDVLFANNLFINNINPGGLATPWLIGGDRHKGNRFDHNIFYAWKSQDISITGVVSGNTFNNNLTFATGPDDFPPPKMGAATICPGSIRHLQIFPERVSQPSTTVGISIRA